ncbi:hypothetical protein [Streptomyces sp. NPDC018000]|uniref:hypothetical protein n=1 Tax=Streptomyces sp. NPDC018000 TaxID=3365028 RepID=UPI0037918749
MPVNAPSPAPSSVASSPSSRRALLRASGLAGLVMAGSAVASGSAQAAPSHAGDVLRVGTVAELR